MGEIFDHRGYGKAGPENVPQLEVIFHEQIGAHDITVLVAENAQGLISWAENFLGTRAQEISWGKLEDLVAGYIQREIKYWVFDLVDLSDDLKSREPINYTFESDFLYFPLEISSLISGTTEITLYTLTDDKIYPQSVQGSGFSIQSFDAGEENFLLEFEVGENDLQRISSEVAELFEGNAWLTVLKYSGSLDDLRGDLMLEAAAGPPPPSPPIPIETWILCIGIAIIAAIVALGLLGVRLPRKSKGGRKMIEKSKKVGIFLSDLR